MELKILAIPIIADVFSENIKCRISITLTAYLSCSLSPVLIYQESLDQIGNRSMLDLSCFLYWKSE